MKKKAIILCTVVLAVLSGVFFAGYWVGSQTWIDGTHFNTEEARLNEVKLAGACINGLHWYFDGNPKEWREQFMLTKEYREIDSLMQHDWEDFYLH